MIFSGAPFIWSFVMWSTRPAPEPMNRAGVKVPFRVGDWPAPQHLPQQGTFSAFQALGLVFWRRNLHPASPEPQRPPSPVPSHCSGLPWLRRAPALLGRTWLKLTMESMHPPTSAGPVDGRPRWRLQGVLK